MMARIIDGDKNNLVGKKIQELRFKKGWSHSELSARLETEGVYICRQTIYRIEAQTRSVTDIELFGFAKIFGVPISALFE